MKILTTNCDCGDPSHIMRFELVEQALTENVNLYLNVQLNPRHPMWRRAWYALLYVLGRKSHYGYGMWDSGSISPESARALRKLINAMLKSVTE